MEEPVLKLAKHMQSAAGDQSLRGFYGVSDRGAQFGPTDLDSCLENRHFRVEYQPKVALLSNKTSQFGVEALCRISDPNLGTISPDKFISVAEANGLIGKLTDAVTCEAFRAWRSWNDVGLSIRLALNVSPTLLDDREWSHSFLQRCAEFSMNPKWITLEITETTAGATNEEAGKILKDLHEKGFSLSIDDFGTGFSSLSTLYRLPIAEMKVDKSFVLEMDRKTGAREVVESSVAMAKRMGIKVVAEGVETQHVFEELRRIGCDEVQGFFIGKSIPADGIVPFFATWQKSRQEGDAIRVLPKVAIIQALLNELANDIAPTGNSKGLPYATQAVPVISDNHLKDLLLKIPPLVLGGKTISALASCHEAIHILKKMPGGHTPCSRIEQLQSQLESELLSSSDLEIRTPSRKYRLLARRTVKLGRSSSVSSPDISIQCPWFDLGNRNLRIFWENSQYFIEDLGSRHGHLVDGVRLEAHSPFPISVGDTLVEACLASGGRAPIGLVLQRRFYDQDAVLVDFEYDEQELLADLGEKAWSTLKGQLESKWIIFNGKISLGRASECSIVLPDCSAPVAATVTFEDGYWITPAAGAEFKAGHTIFGQCLPMVLASEFDVAGSVVTTHRIDDVNTSAAQFADRALRWKAYSVERRQVCLR